MSVKLVDVAVHGAEGEPPAAHVSSRKLPVMS
jgi:hypothetical protein